MSEYWKMVELTDGEPVVFVGVHVLRWQSEWGEPTVGFDRVEETDDEIESLRKAYLNTRQTLEKDDVVQMMLNEDLEIVHCTICGKQISLFTCDYMDGDPVCSGECS
jgi:hypothetical protein